MYLNFLASDHDSYVYRITTLERLKQLFALKENTLVNPKLWDDPFENFILSSKVRHKSGEVRQYNYHEGVYGQCWTFHKESDAMWRIYAQDKKGIRLRSTISELALGLGNAHPHTTSAKCRVGRVRYLSSKKMKEVANETFDDSGIGLDSLFKSLLVKRKAFKHEREVRLLYFEFDGSKLHNQLYSYNVNPHTMISQIMLDPRLPSTKAETMKEEILSATGFKGPIKRSQLYAPPHDSVIDVSDWEP